MLRTGDHRNLIENLLLGRLLVFLKELKVFCTIFVHGAPLDPDVAVTGYE